MLPRVIARQELDAAFLIETRAKDGRRYGRVYDAPCVEVFPEMLLGSIVAMGNGSWVEVEPDVYSDVVDRLSSRLADVSAP
jgi:hypothetical protein